MRTRKAETPKSGATKKTPVKKTTDKTPTKSSEASTAAASPKTATPSPTTTTTTTTPITTASKQPKSAGASKAQTPKTAPKAEPKAEEASASVETPKTGAKKTKTVVKKVVKPSPKAVAVKTTPKANEKSLKKEASKVEETNEEEEPVVENVEEAEQEEEIVAESPKKEEPVVDSVMESKEVESEPVEEEVEDDKEVEEEGDAVDMEEDGTGEELEADEDDGDADEGMEEDGEEGFVEPEIEEGAEDDVEADEEAGRLEEHMEISAAAKERRKKKELEIFIGGLDRDAVEDDVKKVFDKFGEILEVRMHRNQSTNKNKGYAFVKFATKEQATQALNELKNPIICGKRCGTAPSEDNDTLFVGNICNTWTKEAIKKKLKEFGLEGVENITLVPDAQHEGVSRGFAFVGFSCHADAMLAYKRLQKPDVIFGHAERTVKVAFAEPIREPDPEVMAQVKSVFVDGLPPHWDEERVREHFQPHGEIERIVLARNMSTAKRKDFGFVDFTTHEAAMACIDGVNNTELGEGKSKAKVKVRLANPAPKTQAVKGGLCGGFRIGRANSGFSRFGKGFGRGGRPFDRTNDQRSRDSYVRERGRTGRFLNEESKGGSYSGSRGRRPFPERGQKRDTADYFPRDAPSTRSGGGRSRNIAAERGPGKSIHSRRQPYSSEGRFSRPVGGRNYVDDRYQYEESSYGLKRSYSMLDNEPEYLEPIRMRPRFDHPDSVAASREARYQDSYGPRAGLYPHDYYGSTYGSSSYPSMYGGDRSYGGGYYY